MFLGIEAPISVRKPTFTLQKPFPLYHPKDKISVFRLTFKRLSALSRPYKSSLVNKSEPESRTPTISLIPNTSEYAPILNDPKTGILKYPPDGCKPGFNCKRELAPSIK